MSRAGLEPKRDWNELLAISTVPHQPPVEYLVKIEYLLIRWVIKLSQQAQVSLIDQWDSLHSLITRFPYPVAQGDLIGNRKSGLVNSKWLMILELRAITYRVSRPIYGISIFTSRLVNKSFNFAFHCSLCFRDKINLKIISYALNNKKHLTVSENEIWIELACLKYCRSCTLSALVILKETLMPWCRSILFSAMAASTIKI